MVQLLKSLQLTREKLLQLLNEIDNKQQSLVNTFYFRPGSFSVPEEKFGDDGAFWESVAQIITSSDTGGVVIRLEEITYVVLPPFPLKECSSSNTIYLDPLRDLLAEKFIVGAVLLRLGRYAVGVFDDDRLVSSKTGTRYVKGRHKAGGSSQRRFQRIREKQIKELYNYVCSVARNQFESATHNIDFLFLGGARHTIGGFRAECEYLNRMSLKSLDRVLQVDRPSLKELRGLPRQLWMSKVQVFSC